MRTLVLFAAIIATSASAAPAMTLLENQLLACPVAARSQGVVDDNARSTAEARARGSNGAADFLERNEQSQYLADLEHEKCAIAQARAARRGVGR
jgi:hypothetical protein